jgi:protein-S-isoprenylcysteine O-methyltransferase Ste14
MSLIFFVITLTAEVVTTLLVAVSIVLPRQRIWPPSQQHAWGQYVMLILFIVSSVGVVLLGLVDWSRFIIPAWIRTAAGVPLWLIGNLLALWAMAALGVAPTSGDEGALVRRGPYGFSRNPQYLGFIIGLVGWALMANSALTLVASIVGIIPLALVPFAEEPWLLERYGAAYADYRRTVPRFVPWWK